MEDLIKEKNLLVFAQKIAEAEEKWTEVQEARYRSLPFPSPALPLSFPSFPFLFSCLQSFLSITSPYPLLLFHTLLFLDAHSLLYVSYVELGSVS